MKDLIRLYREPAVVVDPPAAVVEPPVADGAKPVDLKPASASATVDINAKPAVVADPFVLPDAYKDKPYLKGVDSQEKLLKMLDGAQELIGKKGSGIPKVDAPKEEWDAYYESIGRPKTAAEYQFDGVDKADPKFLPKVQAAMHKHGLTASQAKGLWADVNGAISEAITEKGLADKQTDVDFEKLATDTFGVERDRILARGKELIYANISPAMKDAVEKLPNESLVVLADVLRSIDKRYIKNDSAPIGQPTVNGGTPAEVSAKARGLMSEQAKHDPMSVEYQSLQKQIDGLYNSLRTAQR